MAAVPLPFTYPDIVCDIDCDPFMAETTSDLQNLIQDVTHVLRELPGSNPDDPDRGVGVELYLGAPSEKFATLSHVIQAQLSLDDRVDTISANITPNPDGTFLVRVDVGVGASVIPLEFGWQNGNFTNLG